MMPKPDCTSYLDKLEEVINANGYRIYEIYRILDWRNLARQVYQPRIDESQDFGNGFEAHAWLLNYLWGNRAVALLLDTDEDKPLDVRVNETLGIKRAFRKQMHGGIRDATFLALMDINKIADLDYEPPEGILGSNSPEQGFVPFNIIEEPGKWDFIYFKYIHCPDHDMKTFNYEVSVLENNSIFVPENLISFEDWKKMKLLKTMIPPSEITI